MESARTPGSLNRVSAGSRDVAIDPPLTNLVKKILALTSVA